MSTIAATTLPALPASVTSAADAHLLQHQIAIWKKTDRLLATLLIFEWVSCICLAIWRSPRTWSGVNSSIHPHVWSSMFLGMAIVSLPVLLALIHSGQMLTRHTIAAAQMLMSGLLIHMGDGRVEMHFHIFGSLAFLAFYRDWKVLITATVVVAAYHLVGGVYDPEAVYGVLSASMWRTFEHSFWVVFEDIFLIGSCIQGVSEMHGIATNRALLEYSYQNVERQVTERTTELKNAQGELMKAARSAGMAEIATSVLHNVGNVLNSVNVSATIVTDKLKQSEVASLAKVSDMMVLNQTNLAIFLTEDNRGKLIPGFITELATCLGEEQLAIIAEVDSLSKGIEHIKKIVAAQQSMAKTSQVATKVKPVSLIDAAVSMQSSSTWTAAEIHRKITDTPEAMIDQHKVLQILINLVSNARHAVMARPVGLRLITMSLEPVHSPTGDRLRFGVADNGSGIAQEHLTKIFSHGFTTKPEGHGFGLHSAINAAREMGGSLSAHSDGPNKGATFILDIPAEFVQEAATCNK